MKYDRNFFDAGLERNGTNCVKWDEHDVCPEGGIPLWVADMDFACAQPIVDAVRERAQHPCFGYSAHNPDDEDSFCAFLKRRHGLDVKPEQTYMMACVVTGLRAAVNTFTEKGDEVLILTPVYGPFYMSINDNHRTVAGCALKEDENGRFSIDFDNFEAQLKKGIKLVMICNPHNPVSRAWSKDELQKILDLTRKYKAVLAVDEIHAEFVFKPNRFVSILELAKDDDQVVSFMSASKTFNIAGLQQAMLVSKNQEILKQLKDFLNSVGGTCGNIFALYATRAAYNKCDDWLDGLMDYLNENRKTLEQIVREEFPLARLTPIEATYLGWLDLTKYGMTVDELQKKCAENKVAFTGGTFFGEQGEYHLRVNFGCPKAQLIEGMKRLKKALEKE